jgi:diacylglycerol kinase family enzyme
VGSDVPLGVLPIGTVNLCATEFGFGRRLEVVARQLVLGKRRTVDVGHLAINGEHAAYFLLVAGIGADAAVLDRTSRALKNHIGSAAVAIAAMRALPALDIVPVRATIDGLPWHGHSGQIIVGNSRRYGALTRVTGGAYVDDGLLDVCIFTTDSLLGAARQASSLLLRQRPAPSSAEIYRASAITIQTLRPLPLEVDGSTVDKHVTERCAEKGRGPIKYAFNVIPGGLRVLVPRTYDGELFQPAPLATTFALGDVVPAVHGLGSNGHSSHSGNDHDHHVHDKQHHRMRVLAVGVDSLLVEDLQHGRRLTVHLRRHTKFPGGDGTVVEGDIVAVEGKHDPDTGTIKAKRITLLDVPAGRP